MTAAEIGRNPVSKHQIQPECGDEQADASGDRVHFLCSADHEQDWQRYPADSYSCYTYYYSVHITP